MARILVIEDEPLVGHMLRRFLERAGHEVVWAPNGEVGLRRLAEGFDLVVCDLIMPGIPGEEVIRRIREEAGPPVLAVSASVSRESQRRALEAGAQAFLGKPFEAQAFLRVVEGLLRGT
ncbi:MULTISPECIES: response regulator transcription factor [Thermus]|jgi:DNA-binding response OmpR family regulator|uniref:Response regulator receiver domain protein n=3 Tax=Thermus thermophilus TaxID=274 RepID=Q5SJ72_THET8|nr:MULTISPECIES: response regulator transcription factor [Thermus]AAS81123.1 two-component response regulator [Thermus thermophilus HB27]QMV30834.1 response regulator [Thermus thermophilus]QZY57752.1 response regulator transcription factor [Thermus thermophilus]WMV96160.1 response regulator transcription factor [Thermus thermophilus HB27]BAD70965.1 response regulator receiver domain protein [Thermus thermophilus HB8]